VLIKALLFLNFQEYPHVKAIFVVGHPSGNKAERIQAKIELEHQKYGDILQVLIS
jgi:hypothetical protein